MNEPHRGRCVVEDCRSAATMDLIVPKDWIQYAGERLSVCSVHAQASVLTVGKDGLIRPIGQREKP